MTIGLMAVIVRTLKPAGCTTGASFVVTDESLIATCTHVVEAAGAGPGTSANIVFHATSEVRQAAVEPAWWRDPEAEDATILKLDEPQLRLSDLCPYRGLTASIEANAKFLS